MARLAVVQRLVQVLQLRRQEVPVVEHLLQAAAIALDFAERRAVAAGAGVGDRLAALDGAARRSICSALPRPLFDCVPMPKINEPVAVAAPVAGSVGNWMRTPLLSVVNMPAGFCNC